MEPLRVASIETRTSVCCLECARVYAKPVGGGTISKNPGCPHCGYVGWAAAGLEPGTGLELSAATPRGRSGADRRQLPSDRPY